MSYEIRIYKKSKSGRIRTGKINNWDRKGLLGWIKLFFILKHYNVRG